MSAPIRVQLRRTKGWKMPPNTVKVNQSSGFRNPFPICKCKSTSMGVTTDSWVVGTWDGPAMWFLDTKQEAAELSVKAFRAWFLVSGLLDRAKVELRGKNLACWCPLSSPCHADVLLELANKEQPA